MVDKEEVDKRASAFFHAFAAMATDLVRVDEHGEPSGVDLAAATIALKVLAEVYRGYVPDEYQGLIGPMTRAHSARMADFSDVLDLVSVEALKKQGAA